MSFMILACAVSVYYVAVTWNHAVKLDKASNSSVHDLDAIISKGSFGNILSNILVPVSLFVVIIEIGSGFCTFLETSSSRRLRKLQRKLRSFQSWSFLILVVLLFLILFLNFVIFSPLGPMNFEISSEKLAQSMLQNLLSLTNVDEFKIETVWNQLQYECCGVYSYADWTNILNNTVPDSCCKLHTPNCTIYINGCLNSLSKHIKIQVTSETITYYYIISIMSVVSSMFIMGCLFHAFQLKNPFPEHIVKSIQHSKIAEDKNAEVNVTDAQNEMAHLDDNQVNTAFNRECEKILTMMITMLVTQR